MGVNVIYNDGFYNKLNPDNYKEAISETVKDVGDSFLEGCQEECPVDTGNLRDSHYVVFDGLSFTINNSAEYWVYVVYGTYKMSANNYPQRVINNIIGSNTIVGFFNDELNNVGIGVE